MRSGHERMGKVRVSEEWKIKEMPMEGLLESGLCVAPDLLYVVNGIAVTYRQAAAACTPHRNVGFLFTKEQKGTRNNWRGDQQITKKRHH